MAATAKSAEVGDTKSHGDGGPAAVSPVKRKAEMGVLEGPSPEKKPFSMSIAGVKKGVEGPPPEKKSFSMSIGGVKKDASKPISMNLGNTKKPVAPVKMALNSQPKDQTAALKPKSAKVASVFNTEDSDEEEMPPEAKMRMRNIGRETPTAAGPNSYGKGRLGFCDRNKMIEREIIKQIEEAGED